MILIFLAVPATMFFGALIALSGFISHDLSFFIAKFAGVVLVYQLAVIKVFAAIVIPLPAACNSIIAFIIYYLVLLIFMYAYA